MIFDSGIVKCCSLARSLAATADVLPSRIAEQTLMALRRRQRTRSSRNSLSNSVVHVLSMLYVRRTYPRKAGGGPDPTAQGKRYPPTREKILRHERSTCTQDSPAPPKSYQAEEWACRLTSNRAIPLPLCRQRAGRTLGLPASAGLYSALNSAYSRERRWTMDDGLSAPPACTHLLARECPAQVVFKQTLRASRPLLHSERDFPINST